MATTTKVQAQDAGTWRSRGYGWGVLRPDSEAVMLNSLRRDYGDLEPWQVEAAKAGRESGVMDRLVFAVDMAMKADMPRGLRVAI